MDCLKKTKNLDWFGFQWIKHMIQNHSTNTVSSVRLIIILIHLLGKLVGLALYNSIPINLNFPLVLFKKLLSDYKPTLIDLIDLDPTLSKSLVFMLEFDGNVEEVFQYTFEIEFESVLGENVKVELIPGGKDIPVTLSNRDRKFVVILDIILLEFVAHYVSYYLEIACEKQFEAFKNGFHTVMNGSALHV